MSVMRGPEGLRHFSKSELLRVLELASTKQLQAEKKLRDARARAWTMVVVAAGLAFIAGFEVGWLLR